ncbi:hypothetical protein, partial [uncultured Jatrophihabitans sp.]|uniref:hypothetical protein n=1 Tax=uncultured Jatrophihabitans sp. TaxID=1610747 RepID=UPI0035CAAC2C
MKWGRIASSVVAGAAVAACALLAIGTGRAVSASTAADAHRRVVVATKPMSQAPSPSPSPSSVAATTTRPAPASTSAAPRPTRHVARHPAVATPTATATSSAHPTPRPTIPSTVVLHGASTPRAHVAPRPTHVAPAKRAAPVRVARAASSGQRLPLHYSTGSATKVITVTAGSARRTTATLQAWTKVSGGWRRYGSAVTAHIGADGMSRHPSESRSATPIGSFTLTQAFGHYRDPGTALPYLHTNSSDWWISQPGRLYNTHQRCSSHCSFRRGNPDEHLYYEMPYYGYGAVIDYNTRNAPGGVHQGAGSAFFLHVTDG